MNLVDVLKLVGPPTCGALFGAAFMFLRRAARESAKTDVELAAEDLARAEREVKAAALTPELDDDARTERKATAAEARLRAARRFKALADALDDGGAR